MADNFFPNANDFDEMNVHLEKIATALGSEIDVSTWGGIRQAVRAGIAPNIFPIGTQLYVKHLTYGDRAYDVVAHDYLKSADNENAHTMTLLSHDLLPTVQFDNCEAFYYAESELPTGTYSFNIPNKLGNWVAGTYQFTLNTPLPEGGRLGLNCRPDVSLSGKYVTAYKPDPTQFDGSYLITNTVTEDAVSLGTFGVELNDINRVAYGSNNYKESALRQYLNGFSEECDFWKPQTKFDLPPSWVSTNEGFLGGLDREFLSVVGKVKLPCSCSGFYEAPDSTVVVNSSYILEDRFYIPSQREVFHTTEIMIEDHSVGLPYYAGASNTDRIKYLDGVASNWRTRTPYAMNLNGTSHRVEAGGVRGGGYARDAYGVAVMCTIV